MENERSAMKVGTDGVLLGAWARLRDSDLEILALTIIQNLYIKIMVKLNILVII